jgi:hypothetical protein
MITLQMHIVRQASKNKITLLAQNLKDLQEEHSRVEAELKIAQGQI